MRKILVCSSPYDLRAASAAVERHGGKVLKALPIARSLVVDVPSDRINDLLKQTGIARIDDDISIHCD